MLVNPGQKSFSHHFFMDETFQKEVFSVVLHQNLNQERFRDSNTKQQNVGDIQIDSLKQ